MQLNNEFSGADPANIRNPTISTTAYSDTLIPTFASSSPFN